MTQAIRSGVEMARAGSVRMYALARALVVASYWHDCAASAHRDIAESIAAFGDEHRFTRQAERVFDAYIDRRSAALRAFSRDADVRAAEMDGAIDLIRVDVPWARKVLAELAGCKADVVVEVHRFGRSYDASGAIVVGSSARAMRQRGMPKGKCS